MDEIRWILNGTPTMSTKGLTILKAAEQAGISIPTLCFLKDCNQVGACRMCVVEVKGMRSLQPACITKIQPDMEVETDNVRIRESRRRTLDLICRNHRMNCEYCVRYSDCELHALVRQFGMDDRIYLNMPGKEKIDTCSSHLVRDNSKCVLCRRCVSTCHMQQADNIAVIGRGTEVSIRNLEAECDGNCIGCGRCIRNCPTGALTERDDTEQVWKNLHGKKKHVAVILSETSLPEFSTFCQTKSGTVSAQTAAAALKKCGVDVVLDAAAGVAFTVNGQLEELKARREKKDTKPLIAAECPAAYRYVQTRFPELKDCLSQVKDPVEQLAQWYRTNYKGEKELFLVSVEPCTARKASCANGESGVDVSLTGREAARMFQRACVSRFTMNQVLDRMNGEMLDFPYGLTSCSCEEYNSKGSLMNALIAKEKLYRAVTVYGLEKGKELLEMVQKKESDMDYLDLLACPKGCR